MIDCVSASGQNHLLQFSWYRWLVSGQLVCQAAICLATGPFYLMNAIVMQCRTGSIIMNRAAHFFDWRSRAEIFMEFHLTCTGTVTDGISADLSLIGSDCSSQIILRPSTIGRQKLSLRQTLLRDSKEMCSFLIQQIHKKLKSGRWWGDSTPRRAAGWRCSQLPSQDLPPCRLVVTGFV